MQNGPRYEVHTKYGWFSLDEGSYQDYLAGKLWITWPPEKEMEQELADPAPRDVSAEALKLRDEANRTGVFATAAANFGSTSPAVPNLPRLAQLSIDELNLSVRAANGLMRAGMNTFGKLAAGIAQEGGLFKIRNLGVKSEKEIRKAYIEECYQRMAPFEKAEYWQGFLDQSADPSDE